MHALFLPLALAETCLRRLRELRGGPAREDEDGRDGRPPSRLPRAVPSAAEVRRNLALRGRGPGGEDRSGLAAVGAARGDPAMLWYRLSGPPGGGEGAAAPRVLMINGLGRPAHDFAAFQDQTQGALQVLAYDSRFVGLSERRSAGLLGRVKSASLAEDALDVMRAVGWADGRGVHVVGYSLGGMAAQELCLRAPGHVRSLSLCVTYSGGSLGSILPPLCFRLPAFLREMAAAKRLGSSSELEEMAQMGAVMVGGRREDGETWEAVLAEQRCRAALYGYEMGSPECNGCAGLLRHTWAAAGHHLGRTLPRCLQGNRGREESRDLLRRERQTPTYPGPHGCSK